MDKPELRSLPAGPCGINRTLYHEMVIPYQAPREPDKVIKRDELDELLKQHRVNQQNIKH